MWNYGATRREAFRMDMKGLNFAGLPAWFEELSRLL